MSKTRHTSKPWVFAYGAVYHGRLKDLKDEPTGIGRLLIADRNNDNTTPTERDANLVLAAAAPEMLEALQLAWPWLEGERRKHRAAREDNEAEHMGYIADKVRAAIDKATGK